MSELKHQLMLNKDMSWVPCYLKSEADAYIRKLKYKRCLAMAEWCEATSLWCYQAANTLPVGFHATLYGKPVMIEPGRLFKRYAFLTKWHKRWLELAENFKPKGGEVMCEYCENGKPLIGDEQDGACIENGNILVSYGECTDFAKGRINFCPQCGRNLAEE